MTWKCPHCCGDANGSHCPRCGPDRSLGEMDGHESWRGVYALLETDYVGHDA